MYELNIKLIHRFNISIRTLNIVSMEQSFSKICVENNVVNIIVINLHICVTAESKVASTFELYNL